MKKTILQFFFLFIIGGAASLGYAPYYVLPLFIFSFLSLIYFIDTAKTKKSSFFYAYAWALGYYSCSLNWIANAFSVRAVTMEDGFVKELIGYSGYAAVLVLAAFLSIYIGAAAIITKLGKDKLQKFCFFTASLAVSEWLRGSLFSGFPWNHFGLVLSFDTTLLQICNFIGF
jgi:apolipoprotein N-acyltransferase